jgi:hypothetical protein
MTPARGPALAFPGFFWLFPAFYGFSPAIPRLSLAFLGFSGLFPAFPGVSLGFSRLSRGPPWLFPGVSLAFPGLSPALSASLREGLAKLPA